MSLHTSGSLDHCRVLSVAIPHCSVHHNMDNEGKTCKGKEYKGKTCNAKAFKGKALEEKQYIDKTFIYLHYSTILQGLIPVHGKIYECVSQFPYNMS